MKKLLEIDRYIDAREESLVGRDNGESVKEKIIKSGIDFDKFENDADIIEVPIPQRIITINKSFFLGLFEERIKALGKEKFLSKYKFKTTEHILNRIDKYIDTALLKASQGDILGV